MSIFVSGALVLAKWHFTTVEKMAKSNVSGGWEVFKGGVSPHDSHSAQRRARP